MAAFNWMKSIARIFSADDEPTGKQKQEVVNSPIFAMAPHSFSEGCDELKGAYGRFGMEISNPIPVNGPVGETVYLNRLRSEHGVGFMYHRLGSMQSPVTDELVDCFQVMSLDLAERYDLYFCMYFFRRSRKAPDGLKLMPWGRLDGHSRAMVKMDCFGTKGRVKDFPHGLPEVLSSDNALNSISPRLGEAMAKRVRQFLTKRDNA